MSRGRCSLMCRLANELGPGHPPVPAWHGGCSLLTLSKPDEHHRADWSSKGQSVTHWTTFFGWATDCQNGRHNLARTARLHRFSSNLMTLGSLKTKLV